MSKEHPARAAGPPGRPVLPLAAEQEILDMRDENGRREVLARGSEYIVVECCSDQQALRAIRQRIQSQMNGLDDSAGKVRCRIRVLDRLISRFRKGA